MEGSEERSNTMTEIRNERLRTLKAKAEAAGRRFEEGKRRLYRNGQQLFSDEVHRDEMDKLARERNGVLFEIESEAREISAGVAGAVERLENSDPADLLSAEELEKANARRAFALDQVDGLSAGDLRKRLDSVLASGDRANIFAYLVAGRHRRERIMERQRERAASSSSSGDPAAATPAIGGTPFDRTLEAMQKALGGEKREAEVEAAKAASVESFEVESVANGLRFDGRSQAQIHSMKNYAVPGNPIEATREAAREAERLANIR